MIKVSVMYPYAAGAFDHAYYRDKHMPMVKQRLGAACLYYTVDKGIAGGAPGTDPVYVAKCDFVCTSIEAFRRRATRMRRRSWPTSPITRIYSLCFKSARWS